ncbi:M61 family metallopeptidase [Solimonas marina]|uniref:M61 family metallopeptidase n=1 Tax=Solimonas marina TaxID=2714601 RepID=A0A969WEG5_9GAMM|nr:M61 family metallopeptidase [Solimonas marina]NKF24625.1 M61 family metallopeptidase [Solimonas marina]
MTKRTKTPTRRASTTTQPPVMTVEVDATDTARRILAVRQRVPTAGETLSLRFPQWLPGHHSPYGPVHMLGGLTVSAGKRRLDWVRDPGDVYRFDIALPAGTTAVDVEFQCLTPVSPRQGRVTMTDEIIDLQWNLAVLYPAGHDIHTLMVQPSLKLPAKWSFACALDVTRQKRDWTEFAPASLATLIDSPLFAGLHFKRVPLDGNAKSGVFLNVVADEAQYLEAKSEQIDAHAKLVREARTLFQSRHYRRYEFLLSLSDKLGGIGLEHHESSENGVSTGYFTEWDKNVWHRDLLPHEYVHSWNGKFRRPAGQCVPDYSTPLVNELLWVYEGQTQYWGQVLAARAGLWTTEFALNVIATVAATFEFKRPGRKWRPLVDTTLQPIVIDRQPLSYVTWQRTEDYYQEGQLIWLDIDTRLRELTNDQRSLDDFAAAFFGIKDGDRAPTPYTFDDVVTALKAVAEYDWARYLQRNVYKLRPRAVLDGLSRGGWKLAFAEEPGAYLKSVEAALKMDDFSYSLGLSLTSGAIIGDVVWGGVAFKAGLRSGMKLLAVDQREYRKERLITALKQARKRRRAIDLLVKDGDHYRTVSMAYYDGPRYPTLERIDGTPDRLTQIYGPRT